MSGGGSETERCVVRKRGSEYDARICQILTEKLIEFIYILKNVRKNS